MYAEILICASLVIAAVQDVRERAVLDLVWIPAAIGVGYSILVGFPSVELQVVKVALVGGIALAFTLLGQVGQADAIALAVIAGDPSPLSPILPLVFTGVVAGIAIGVQFTKGNARGTKSIPIEQFLKEQRWIPRAVVVAGRRIEVDSDVNVAREEVAAKFGPGAVVEVVYGVPTVAYIGLGYVAFLLYLLAFAPQAFLSLP